MSIEEASSGGTPADTGHQSEDKDSQLEQSMTVEAGVLRLGEQADWTIELLAQDETYIPYNAGTVALESVESATSCPTGAPIDELPGLVNNNVALLTFRVVANERPDIPPPPPGKWEYSGNELARQGMILGEFYGAAGGPGTRNYYPGQPLYEICGGNPYNLAPWGKESVISVYVDMPMDAKYVRDYTDSIYWALPAS